MYTFADAKDDMYHAIFDIVFDLNNEETKQKISNDLAKIEKRIKEEIQDVENVSQMFPASNSRGDEFRATMIVELADKHLIMFQGLANLNGVTVLGTELAPEPDETDSYNIVRVI